MRVPVPTFASESRAFQKSELWKLRRRFSLPFAWDGNPICMYLYLREARSLCRWSMQNIDSASSDENKEALAGSKLAVVLVSRAAQLRDEPLHALARGVGATNAG